MALTPTSTSTPTATPTPTPSTNGVVKSAAQQVLTSLSTGSGIDTTTLVSSLVQSQFAAKNAALAAKGNALTAQISAAGTLKSTLATFTSALGGLASGGTLQSQPVSSNTAVVSASAISGARIGNLNTSVTVSALATAQTARSKTVDNRAAPIGSGSFTLTTGTASYDTEGKLTGVTAGKGAPVTITVTNGSLDGIASAINDARAGVTASVITDQNGKAVLSLKGTTGTDQAFSLQSTDDGLADFNVGPGTLTTITGTAGNAKLTVDGVTVERSSNSVSDVVAGVKLQLNAVSTTPVTLGSTRPTTALTQAVTDFVDTYNQVFASVKAATDPVTGDLKSDTAAKSLLSSLQGLTIKSLVPTSAVGVPTTLAQIGVSTNRDGTLTVNTDTLNKMLAAYPDEVEAMFAARSGNVLGLDSKISGISIATASTVSGLGASATRYGDAQKALTLELAKVTTLADTMTTRMTQQFSSMNSKVTAYKATQTFLENQIKAWNADR